MPHLLLFFQGSDELRYRERRGLSAVRVDESPSDVEQLSGAALLARELGAQVITDKK